ncbi:hypothetical protein BLNAU_25284 [Blattamonas nauphoetae]|uniref:Uncharacterized protein n=1 Tax=Blattamonas nauphoetae TaxID=2049346 RepID=A0ABQ9WKF2_9EUKA|nr:hypothetical protein BLNAU_25284 [Blattamonas nauphoetae]
MCRICCILNPRRFLRVFLDGSEIDICSSIQFSLNPNVVVDHVGLVHSEQFGASSDANCGGCADRQHGRCFQHEYGWDEDREHESGWRRWCLCVADQPSQRPHLFCGHIDDSVRTSNYERVIAAWGSVESVVAVLAENGWMCDVGKQQPSFGQFTARYERRREFSVLEQLVLLVPLDILRTPVARLPIFPDRR